MGGHDGPVCDNRDDAAWDTADTPDLRPDALVEGGVAGNEKSHHGDEPLLRSPEEQSIQLVQLRHHPALDKPLLRQTSRQARPTESRLEDNQTLVAQLDRVSGFEPDGWGFESLRACPKMPPASDTDPGPETDPGLCVPSPPNMTIPADGGRRSKRRTDADPVGLETCGGFDPRPGDRRRQPRPAGDVRQELEGSRQPRRYLKAARGCALQVRRRGGTDRSDRDGGPGYETPGPRRPGGRGRRYRRRDDAASTSPWPRSGGCAPW